MRILFLKKKGTTTEYVCLNGETTMFKENCLNETEFLCADGSRYDVATGEWALNFEKAGKKTVLLKTPGNLEGKQCSLEFGPNPEGNTVTGDIEWFFGKDLGTITLAKTIDDFEDGTDLYIGVVDANENGIKEQSIVKDGNSSLKLVSDSAKNERKYAQWFKYIEKQDLSKFVGTNKYWPKKGRTQAFVWVDNPTYLDKVNFIYREGDHECIFTQTNVTKSGWNLIDIDMSAVQNQEKCPIDFDWTKVNNLILQVFNVDLNNDLEISFPIIIDEWMILTKNTLSKKFLLSNSQIQNNKIEIVTHSPGFLKFRYDCK